MGPVLARPSLPMREWGTDPDEEPDDGLRLEAAVIGASVLAAYGFLAYLLAASLFVE